MLLTLLRTKRARYFLFDFGHADRPFREVIGEWHDRIAHEQQHRIGMAFQALQQIERDRLFAASALARRL